MIKAVCSDAQELYQLEATLAPEAQQKFNCGSHFEAKFRDIMNQDYVLSHEDLVHTRSRTIAPVEHKLKVWTRTEPEPEP